MRGGASHGGWNACVGWKKQGIALVTALFILTVVTILGLSFSFLATRDLYFAQRQERGTQALYLARAGIEYYISRGLPDRQDGGPPRVYPSENKDCYCELEVRGTLLYCRGIIQNASGEIVAKRTLVSPLWTLGAVYEVSGGEAP